MIRGKRKEQATIEGVHAILIEKGNINFTRKKTADLESAEGGGKAVFLFNSWKF